MVVLGLTGFVLFAVSAAVLAVPQTTNILDTVLSAAWQSLGTKQKTDIQDRFNCCGFDNKSSLFIHDDMDDQCLHEQLGHPFCNTTFLMKVSLNVCLCCRWIEYPQVDLATCMQLFHSCYSVHVHVSGVTLSWCTCITLFNIILVHIVHVLVVSTSP